jgi:hypothetical protein
MSSDVDIAAVMRSAPLFAAMSDAVSDAVSDRVVATSFLRRFDRGSSTCCRNGCATPTTGSPISPTSISIAGRTVQIVDRDGLRLRAMSSG